MTIWTAKVLQEAERIVEEAGPQSEEGRREEEADGFSDD